jgi:hypothetical protein
MPTDEAVAEMMRNYVRAATSACPNDSAKRIALKEQIFSWGQRHDFNNFENDFVN